MELLEIATKLNDIPLHYFSLNNTELFHSNFWKWLSTIDKLKTLNLFHKNNVTDEVDIEFDENAFRREEGNIDFKIVTKNKIVIIENKIKSVTTEPQLLKYYDKVLKKNKDNIIEIDFILVTPYKDDDIIKRVNDLNGGKYRWRNLTYRDIYDNLEQFKTENDFYNKIIENYRELLFNISEFFKVVDTDGLNYNFYSTNHEKKEIFDALKNIKMFDIYKKYKSSRIALELYKYFKKEFEKRNIAVNWFTKITSKKQPIKYDGSINIKYGYNNLSPTIDIFVIYDKFGLGIQIQDKEYRYVFFQWKNATDTAKKLLKNNIWITNGKLGKGQKGNEMNQYCSKIFGDHFFYKYNLIEGSETNFETLKNKLHKDILNAIDSDTKKIRKILAK